MLEARRPVEQDCQLTRALGHFAALDPYSGLAKTDYAKQNRYCIYGLYPAFLRLFPGRALFLLWLLMGALHSFDCGAS